MKTVPLLSVAAWLASAALAVAANSAGQLPELSPGRVPAPFTLPGAVQYDFTAKTNQLPYRVMVWAPADAKTQAYPVIYLLDGNTWFPAAAVEGWHFNNAIMVGVGVPSNEVAEWRRRRVLDLTPTEDQRRSDSQTGGGAAFAKVLFEEIKPFIKATYKIAPGRQTLYGLSLGGLMTTHMMFTQPQAFDTYVVCSPILGWNNSAVLKTEPAFTDRARLGEFRLRVLVTAAGDESKPVIDGASALADRLKQLPKPAVDTHYFLFANETHGSVSLATIGRALTFALQTSDAPME
jgi:predicted alpha/beta superfamily hydrolase